MNIPPPITWARTTALLLLAWPGTSPLPQTARAAEFDLNGHHFTLPDGFTIELAATVPITERPIVADFDDQGRLYVSEASGTNDPVQRQLADKPHRILRLEDSDGDGVFDQRTVFAEGMMFPEGAMWHRGSFYVGAPPAIWKLTDRDGDGVADERIEWMNAQTLTGCANDLHGPYAGPDGWIYWCKGAFAEQHHLLANGRDLVTRAAHMFRARPDGTGIEPVMTGGMDNPVEVAFGAGGERFFTTTFVHHPRQGERDAVVHAVYGGVYGKDHDVLRGHPRTGELMPVMAELGPAAPSGLTRFASARWGAEYQDNLFATLFNMRKVVRLQLTPEKATFTAAVSDFVVSDQRDFHPTDVLADADGSLLIVDTGGWYKLCCPTSQLYKPDVLGAIYRVRRSGLPPVADPRGLQLEWQLSAKELAARLSDPREAVRQRASEALALRADPDAAVAELTWPQQRMAATAARREAVWTLSRIGTPAALAANRQYLRQDPDLTVRGAAWHVASVHRDAGVLPELSAILLDAQADAQLRRVAAETAGRLGNRSVVPDLLQAIVGVQDRVFEHSLIYALIEIGDDSALRAPQLLTQAPAEVSRAALIALDQFPGDRRLQLHELLPLLDSADAIVAQAAAGIAEQHPEWAGELLPWLAKRLRGTTTADTAFVARLARFARDNDQVAELLAQEILESASSSAVRLAALQAMEQSGRAGISSRWAAAIGSQLESTDPDLVQQAVRTARRLASIRDVRVPELAVRLTQIAGDERVARAVRVQAVEAVIDQLHPLPDNLHEFLLANVNRDQPPAVRGSAAAAIARADLSDSQRIRLTACMGEMNAPELSAVLEAFRQQKNADVGQALARHLTESPLLASVGFARIRDCCGSFPETIRQQLQQLFSQIDATPHEDRLHLEQILNDLPGGDIRRGQEVFNSNKAACITCHAIGYNGGKLGPDLTRVGQIRSREDLLESIVFPSSSFVRSYEPTVVVTEDGRTFNGLLTRQDDQALVLTSQPDKEERIDRADVAEVQPSKVSIMPAGMDRVLSRQELADLLEFLTATKW